MYRRLVLKLSGQAIAGSSEFGFSSDRLTHLANEVIALRATGVQRAVELDADALLVAKNGADGVYDADPNTSPTATRFDHLTYQEVIDRGLGVMDQSAFILARDHRLPLHVFDIDQTGAASTIATGNHLGTLIN
ncbi:amino acid kinase family protein [Kribbella steppae]|uniref:UMP kinase n=1 Tax=Kribbella steppae TaxID=2512223 RepID=A0A4R2HH09_9ACTN|nr:hypothetical protein [Kribbella steppae]TCO28461.1 amino acid kinase family protein [Kribbella steppae]